MATEELYRKLSASDLSAIILKGSSPSNDRDTGFCSGSSEGGDDLSVDHSRLEPRSPTDASEDSIEVKVTPICFTRNKRKSTEPSRVICEQETGPLKKRIRYTSLSNDGKNLSETVVNTETTNHHFRPWDQNQLSHEEMPNPAEILVRHPGVTTLHRALNTNDDIQEEPLALIAKKPSSTSLTALSSSSNNVNSSVRNTRNSELYNGQQNISHSQTNNCSNISSDIESIPLTVNCSNNGNNCNNKSTLTSSSSLSSSSSSSSPIPISLTATATVTTNCISTSSTASTSSQQQQRPQQRNYKNMTRERRIEANARERTRVHTISAAYDTLRRAIPSYSHTQKLSKLSVLRVACSYILTLSRMAGQDYSEDQSEPTIAQCFDIVTKTIQTEGKIRKKKDE